MSINETRTIIEGIEKLLTNRDFKFKTEAVFKTDDEFPESKWVQIYITVAPIGGLIENVTPQNAELNIWITVSDSIFSIEFIRKDIINTTYDENLYYKEFSGKLGDSKSDAFTELDKRLTYVRLKYILTQFIDRAEILKPEYEILKESSVSCIKLEEISDTCSTMLSDLLKIYE